MKLLNFVLVYRRFILVILCVLLLLPLPLVVRTKVSAPGAQTGTFIELFRLSFSIDDGLVKSWTNGKSLCFAKCYMLPIFFVFNR